jgi:hypothetical protein
MTRPTWQRNAMRRVGSVLMAVGAIDIIACTVTVANGGGYGSSLNIFALVAGVMVYRGHVGAVRGVVRWFSFMFGAALLLPIMLVVGELFSRRVAGLPPIETWRWVTGMVSWMALLALFYWVRRTLAVLPVFADDRPAKPIMRSPDTAVGVSLAVIVIIVFTTVAASHAPN